MLETLKAQAEITPQQMQAMLATIAEMNDNLQDVGQAVATILDGLEAVPQSVPPEAAIEQPMENVVV